MAKATLSVVSEAEITIDKGIAIPKYTGDATRKYPLNKMDVGDSFAVPGITLKQARSAIVSYGKTHQMKFSIRRMPDGTHRCWRIA